VRARPAPQSFLTESSRCIKKFEIILSLKGSAASAASRSLRHLYARPLRGLEKVGSIRPNLKDFASKKKRKNFKEQKNSNGTPVVTSSDDSSLTSVPLKKSSVFCWLHF
jgi:hypothetical protein